jgi:hypothetical protein
VFPDNANGTTPARGRYRIHLRIGHRSWCGGFDLSREGRRDYAAHADRFGVGFTLSTEGGCFAKRLIMIA